MQDSTQISMNGAELPLLITDHGRITVSELFRWNRRPPGYQFIFPVQGSGHIVLSDREMLLQEGMSAVLFPHAAFSCRSQEESWILRYFSFNGYLLPGFLHTLQIVDTSVFRLDPAQQMLMEEIILFRQSNQQEGGFITSALLYMLLIKLKLTRDRAQPAHRRRAKLKLSGLVSYIQQNYHLDISLSMLAEQMSVTEQHLNRVFKKEYHMTPIDFLTRYRLHKAKELLIHNKGMTGHDISKAVGFKSPSYFGSVFKKYEGCSPIELRKKYRAKE